jgi:hypothetical protein
MEDFIISVGRVEELQTLNDRAALDELFQKARRILVGGGKAVLVRELRSGESYRFEEFTNLEDLEGYRQQVCRYVL